MLNSKNLKNIFFLVTIIFLFIGIIYVFSPYLSILFISIILVELFYPVYKFLETKLKYKSVASFLSLVIIILTVLIPITIITIILVFQINTLLSQVSGFWQDHDLVAEYKNVLDEVNQFIMRFTTNPDNQITHEEIKNFATNFSQNFLEIILHNIQSMASGALGIVTKFFLLLISIFSLFPVRDSLYEEMKKISPLEDRLDDIFIEKFRQTAQAVIKGTFMVAIGLGIIGGFLYWILGIQAPVFWGLMITVFSIIPVGSGIIWIPTSIYLAVTGQVIKAIILFIAGLIMTNGIDTLLRTKLVKTDTTLHPLVLAFAILGGLEVFGILGFLYGPLIVVLFFSMMEVYKEKF